MSAKRTTPILIAVLVACLGLAAAAQAQTTKVAVINSQQAFLTSTEGKKATAQLQDMENKLKADLSRMDNEIKATETKINTQRMTLSNEAMIQLQSELDRKTTARKRREEDGAREGQQFQINLMNRMRGEMISIIEGLAKEKGFDLILDLGQSGVVYFNPVLDVTEEVIRRYDASKATAPKK